MDCDFPTNLSKLRRERGISQKKTALELGISQALLSHYENGIRECGLDFLVRAADYFGVTTDYLLGRTFTAKETACGETPLEIRKKQALGSMELIFELLQHCEKDDVCETGLDIIDLQVYQTALYIFGVCHGELPFAFPSRYAKPACESAIVGKFAKLGLVKEKNDSLSFPLVSAEHLSSQYPEQYDDLCRLISLVEDKLK